MQENKKSNHSKSKQLLLGINIDHVATLRQVRQHVSYPDPVQAALMVQAAGADGLTLHLREDYRHIQVADVIGIRKQLKIPMNLEMAATDTMTLFALDISPAHCCLVPERREELTTEGGLDVVSNLMQLAPICERLQEAGIVVSLFIDPELAQIAAAKECGVSTIELHTGQYADSNNPIALHEELQRLQQAADYAHSLGLIVNAGHGLNYDNVQAVAKIPELHELNIGHSIVARAIFVGLTCAVQEMRALL